MDDRAELDLRQLERSITKLSANEHHEILAMIPEDLVSKNKNGAFCDLACLPPDALASVRGFVDFSIDNNQKLAAYDRDMHQTALLLHRTLPATQGTPTASLRTEKSTPPRVPAPPKSSAKLAFMRRSGDVRERQVPYDLLTEESKSRH
jgi:hypothetical protein